MMKMWPEWKNLERYEADKFLGRWLGKSGYETIWQPLLKAKFGKWYKQVNAAWFWARIKKRTPSLGYFYEGFQGFANHLQKQITAAGGSVFLNTPVKKVGKIGTNLQLVSPGKKETFDKVLVTTNNSIFLKLAAGLPDQEREKLAGLQSLNALVTVLVAKKPLMDTVYWLNVLDNGLPFVVVAEQTKLVEPARYNGSRLIYFGTYLTPGQKLFSLADEEIFQMAIRQANKINPAFTETDVEKYFIFRAKETQPLVKTKHSKSVPNLRTGINNLYLANMNSIYPWDRGTNYAVELGERAVKMIEGE